MLARPCSQVWRYARVRREQGFALLVVLVTLAALSLLWGAVVSGTRQYTAEATARLAALRLKGALDGALATTAFDLSRPMADFDGARHVQIGAIMVEVRIRPETAKLDLNTANPGLISKLLYAAGLSEGLSDRLARRIAAVRLRDASGQKILSGDNRSGQLESVADLISGMRNGDDLVACLGTDVTLFSHSPDVAVHWASVRLREAALSFDPKRYSEASASLTSIVGGEASRPNIIEIIERARDEATNLQMTRQVVIRLTGHPEQLYQIVTDRSPVPSDEVVKSACERLSKAGL